MRIDILSLFPEYFTSPLDASILGRARKKRLIDINLVDIRAFAADKYESKSYRRVDDRPYGGGPGMVLMAEPVVKAIRRSKLDRNPGVKAEDSNAGSSSARSHVVYLSPQGTLLTAAKSRELASYDHLILLCGHYEGVDERAIQSEVDEEISIGDYVLTNGCVAALVVLDALSRFIPDVLGNEKAAEFDSFEQNGCFDWPQYTRPEVFEGMRVPEELLSGNHEKIARWREKIAKEKTAKVRPELLNRPF